MSTARLSRHIAVDHPAFAGHFPGQPLLPGVSLLAEVLEAACAQPGLGERLAAGATLQAAKFLAPVRPGASLALALDWDDAGLRFEVAIAGSPLTAAKGHWTWAAPTPGGAR